MLVQCGAFDREAEHIRAVAQHEEFGNLDMLECNECCIEYDRLQVDRDPQTSESHAMRTLNS